MADSMSKGFADDAQILVLSDHAAEDEKSQPIYYGVAVEIQQTRNHIRHLLHAVAVYLDGHSLVYASDDDEKVIYFEGNVLHRICGDGAEKDVQPRFVVTEFQTQHGDSENTQKQHRREKRVVSEYGQRERHAFAYDAQTGKTQRIIFPLFQAERKQPFGYEQFGGEYGLVPEQRGRLIHTRPSRCTR